MTARDEFPAFLARCRDGVSHQVSGQTEGFQVLWAHDSDVVLMGAGGEHQVGWPDVSAHLSAASANLSYDEFAAENLMTLSGDEFAVTIDIEHMTRHDVSPALHRTLRVTHVYRHLDDGWVIVARHGDPLDDPTPLGITDRPT